ncbi:MAG: hypothetical protein IIV86_06215 [Bacteroidaceae bacterium]|nr:hypothetical protein [Bacteroidaceae bacterium]
MKTLLAAVAVATTAMSATADDRFYIENFDIAPGETKTVSIVLDNTGDFVAFQSDVYLPEGLTADNWTLTERKDDHSFSKSNPATGVTRIVAITLTNSSIKGNTGALATFDVTAAEDLTVGTTLDGKVASSQFSYINGTYETLAEEAYTVTVVEAPAEPANRFYIEDFEIEAGGTYRLPFNLVNEDVFYWFTATLTLPEGLSFTGELIENVTRVTSRIYDETEYPTDGSKVLNLDFSARNDFEGNEGALVYLDIVADDDFAGNGTITLTNIVFFDADDVEYPLEDVSCVATLPAIESNEVELLVQNSYYNNLTLYLTKGATQKLKIESTDEYFELNTILFNGEDVTEDFVEGVYTTPAIEENSVLNISFTIPTAQDAPMQNSRIKAYGYRGDVVVTGCERGESIAVYDVDGVLLRTMFATSDTMRIAMPTDAVYVVKVADAAVKVAL